MSYSMYSFVQAALLLQLFAWFNLYHHKQELPRSVRSLFYTGMVLMVPLIRLTQPRIGYFTPWILTQYTVFILVATMLYETRFSFNQAISLGFLTVFLNSFYWEFWYHIYEFVLWLPMSLGFTWWYLRFPQWIRVMPVYFLRRNFSFKRLWVVVAGAVVSLVLTWYRFTYRAGWVQPIHRSICLAVLIYVVLSSETKQNIV